MLTVRAAILQAHGLAKAEFTTIHLRLLKLVAPKPFCCSSLGAHSLLHRSERRCCDAPTNPHPSLQPSPAKPDPHASKQTCNPTRQNTKIQPSPMPDE